MPGFRLRLRGGRKARFYTGKAARRIVGYRDPQLPGSTLHLIQLVDGSNVPTWNEFQAGIYSPFAIETIATTYDGAFAVSNPVAACLIADRPIFYNGQGVRDSVLGSKPPFSSYYQGVVRYYGLDCYCPTAPFFVPTVSWSGGPGNNAVQYKVTIYAGLYNQDTEHYSNGLLVGSVSAQSGSGTISVDGLNLLKYVSHTNAESLGLKYVFYATVDRLGSETGVPYLILNATLDGPYTVNVTSTSASLSISSETINGWVLDQTKEMPVKNYPPRPMRSICYVNGRLYGALLMAGSGGNLDFTYVPAFKDLAAVVYSLAPGDIQRNNSIGDPLQCWPTLNIAYTPSADAPVVTVPAQDSVRVLVITPSSTFLLQEIADGIHEWITVSRLNGCGSAASVVTTQYGICWVSQRGHLVMLPSNSLQLVDLSAAYRSLITSAVTAADYICDENNLIDRYQVWLADGTSVIHDFALSGDGSQFGEGYNATNYPGISAAATVLDQNAVQHHIIASATAIYTHEAQFEDGLIPTTDQTYTNSTTVTTAEINGEYRSNWTAEGDLDNRKQLNSIDIIGDVEPGNWVAATFLEWYSDFEQVGSGNVRAMANFRTPQTLRNYWRFKPSENPSLWYKFVVKMAGHHADAATYPLIATEGDLSQNFYGWVLEMLKTYSSTVNRP